MRARSLSSAQVIKVFSRTQRVELTAAVDVPAGLAGFEQAMGYAQKREFEYDAAAAGGGAATPALPTDLCWSGGRLLVCSEHVRQYSQPSLRGYIEGSGGGCVEVLDTATGGRLSILQIPGPGSLRRALVCSRANSAENRRALLCRRTWVLGCALVVPKQGRPQYLLPLHAYQLQAFCCYAALSRSRNVGDAGELQMGEHAIQAVRPLPHVLQEEHGPS